MKTFHHLRISALSCFFLFTISCYTAGTDLPKKTLGRQDQKLSFTENKGQIYDQNNKPRKDVLFGGTDGALSFFIKQDGISYQLYKPLSWKKQELNYPSNDRNESEVPDLISIYRVDITWLNANKSTKVLKEVPSQDYTNYYTINCPEKGITVKQYGRVTFKNLYKGIDLAWYEKSGHLKYDCMVAPGADYKQIQFEINGAETIRIASNGELIIKTPLGDIVEGKPVVVQNGKLLRSKWILQKNILSYEISNVDLSFPLVIDPAIRVWGTHYGGTGEEYLYTTIVDGLGNVYITGATESWNAIATTGSYQNAKNFSEDAFLAKFNPAGQRIWATYYGGNGTDWGHDCAVDGSNNVFLAGITTSTASIATAMSYQSSFNGAGDAFLVKFNSAGSRIWATYYGGNGLDDGNCCATDSAGNIYLAGRTEPPGATSISSPGSHQVLHGGGFYDAFLVKFSASGVRQWATYYGGAGDDYANACSIDPLGNIYMAGQATTSTGISIGSPGSHQATNQGGLDGFLAKFNGLGTRLWGTYYGGSGYEIAFGCVADQSGCVYLGGVTTTSTGTKIASPGAYQTAYGGGIYDAFLARFDSTGLRQWGTYYGGPGIDYGFCCVVDSINYVFLSGVTTSTLNNLMATNNSAQAVSGGSVDAFFAKFDPSGLRQWGTYYGGAGGDRGVSCAADPVSGNIYLAGTTTSSVAGTSIATAASHQSSFGGGAADAFLVRFKDCVQPSSPINTTPQTNLSVCLGSTTTLSATGTGTIQWFASPNSMQVLGTGTTFLTPNLGLGTYSFYASGLTCAPSASRTLITLTVSATPTVFAISTNSINCVGQNVALGANGANSYTWYPGGLIGSLVNVSPSVTTNYTVFGSSGNQCQGSALVTQSVVPFPTISVNSGTLCSGHVFTILPNGANTYTIEGGSALVSPTTNASYTVIGGINNGCISANTATCNISVLPSPTVSASASNTLICPGQPVTLSGTGGISFTWSPGIPLTGIVNPSSSINYSFTASGSNFCETTAIIIISVDACTSIESRGVDQSNVILYPNPNQGSFTIQAGEPVEIKIFNALGQIVYQGHLKQGSQSITLNHVAKGIYLVKVETKQKVQTLRWIKE